MASCRKPVIAAVAGFALGGGCELAMMCDFIIAADNAKFGQPEITIGTIPGARRHAAADARRRQGEGDGSVPHRPQMEADEAERAGLVARVVPLADLLAEAMKAAEKIAGIRSRSP